MTPTKIRFAAVGALAILALAPGAASAQEMYPGVLQEIHEAMQALPDLEGRWQGEGWMRRGPQEPSQFLSEEVVETKLDGQLLVIEGVHHSTEDPSREIFHAFAVLSYDPEADAYRFHSHTAEGRSGDFEGRVENGAFVWGLQVPGGQIRYVLRVDQNRWDEVGEFSADGDSWNKFFEMKLQRVE